MPLRKARRWATSAALVALFAGGPFAHAQEVVQALPPPGSQELSNALQRLARDGNDVAALLDAGDAAITLGDVAAAIGFFGRAQALTPTNPRISLGLARAYTLSRRPVEALRLYAEAEKGGIPLQSMAADRALAFDLVGDAKSAQELYRMALAGGAGDAVRRHLALSHAISGDKAGFEATLLPLLQQGDNAAFRTRAFGLAILGETDAAIKIARDMMPAQMASRIEPYLKYMTQLTPAQQAAAGVLGVFPRTAAIGQDDAQIAAYSPPAPTQAQSADASLAPSGPTLGSQLANNTRGSRRERRQERRERREASRTELAPAQTSAPAQASAPAPARSGELPPVGRTTELPPVQRDAATQPIDLGAQPVRPAPPPPPPPPTPPPPRENLEDAFADFNLAANGSTAPRAGAVDIRAIEAPRERNEPPPPVIPARHWVQVATGRDISALGFDWRRISRNAQGELAGKSAFTAPWGEANRLLAGPYDSSAEAREVVNRLKAIGVDSFPFTSARGEEVFALSGASPAPEAARPSHPSRNWVQVATGRDRDALGFDWRRIARKADGSLDGKGPFVVTWGEANRLLAGPYDSPAEAREMVNRLKAMGIDSFTFTSEDGEAIEELD
ncbi:SPOR domain-containing protein [Qipengyuania sp. 1NDH17]|uniref:SPOR domain-containing protein n=1 Tax=Qipengyuania polymorpha TaxID=2867234 RepID=A0ABS7J3A2_9SPHN|nr:SPOR domain-containing protein [Qipengyuania polymorpha]MBX7457943.1 SPOR domain-containing protein [Qipengyuania polymorpha]